MSLDRVSADRVPDGYEDVFLENVELVEEYNVSEYADVLILYNTKERRYLYYINEPDISEYERIRADAASYIPYKLSNEGFTPDSRDDFRSRVRELAQKRITKQEVLTARIQNRLFELVSNVYEDAEKYQVALFDEETINRIIYYLERDLVNNGKLQPVFNDPYIEDIHVNEPGIPVFLYHSKYGGESNIMTNIEYTQEELQNKILGFTQMAGKTVSSAKPIENVSLPDGSRVNINYTDEVTDGGSTMTIRLFDEDPLTPTDLIQYGTFSLDQMAYFWLSVEHEKSIMFVGGTASGKTTSMNAISMFIPEDLKFVTIEDTREVEIDSANWVKNVTRDSASGDVGEIDMFDLLKDALRKRPNYIMVGEVRGAEAQTLFEAMNTGHATLSTFHAEGVPSAKERLTGDQLNVPVTSIPAIDIMSIQDRLTVDDEVVRRAEMVEEINDVQQAQVDYSTMYEYKYDSDKMRLMQSHAQSNVLSDIMLENGWTENELEQEIENRKNVLQAMVENDINNYVNVSDIIQLYIRDNEYVVEQVESGNIEQLIGDTE